MYRANRKWDSKSKSVAYHYVYLHSVNERWQLGLIQGEEEPTRAHWKLFISEVLFCWCRQEGSAGVSMISAWLHFSMCTSSVIDSTGKSWAHRKLPSEQFEATLTSAGRQQCWGCNSIQLQRFCINLNRFFF